MITRKPSRLLTVIAILTTAVPLISACKPKTRLENADGTLIWAGLKRDKNGNTIQKWGDSECVVVTTPLMVLEANNVRKNGKKGYDIEYQGYPMTHPEQRFSNKISLGESEYLIVRPSGPEIRSHRSIDMRKVLAGDDYTILLQENGKHDQPGQ